MATSAAVPILIPAPSIFNDPAIASISTPPAARSSRSPALVVKFESAAASRLIPAVVVSNVISPVASTSKLATLSSVPINTSPGVLIL